MPAMAAMGVETLANGNRVSGRTGSVRRTPERRRPGIGGWALPGYRLGLRRRSPARLPTTRKSATSQVNGGLFRRSACLGARFPGDAAPRPSLVRRSQRTFTGISAVARLSLSNRRKAPRRTINSTGGAGAAFDAGFFFTGILRDLIGHEVGGLQGIRIFDSGTLRCQSETPVIRAAEDKDSRTKWISGLQTCRFAWLQMQSRHTPTGMRFATHSTGERRAALPAPVRAVPPEGRAPFTSWPLSAIAPIGRDPMAVSILSLARVQRASEALIPIVPQRVVKAGFLVS